MEKGQVVSSGLPATVESEPSFHGAIRVGDASLRISISWTVTAGPQRETAKGDFFGDFDLQGLSGDWGLWKTYWTDSGKT